MSTGRLTSSSPTRSRGDILFILVGGGVAWFFHLVAAYVISEFGCRLGWGSWHIGSLSLISWLLISTTAIAITTAITGVWISARAYRAEALNPESAAYSHSRNQRSIARIGLITNALFTFIIIAQAVPILFYLRTC